MTTKAKTQHQTKKPCHFDTFISDTLDMEQSCSAKLFEIKFEISKVIMLGA